MGLKTENVTGRVVMLGDNRFESGAIAIDAGETIKAGTLLMRIDGGRFAPVVDSTPTPGNPGVPADGGGWATEPTDPISRRYSLGGNAF